MQNLPRKSSNDFFEIWQKPNLQKKHTKLKNQKAASAKVQQAIIVFNIAECLSFSSFSPLSIIWISCSLYELGFIFYSLE